MFKVCAAGAFLLGLLVFTGCGAPNYVALDESAVSSGDGSRQSSMLLAPLPVKAAPLATTVAQESVSEALPATGKWYFDGSKWYFDNGKWYCDQD